MVHNYPYLKDSVFLKQFDHSKLKEGFVKIIILTFDEKPIKAIEGKMTGGNINLDGSSSMRRTGNISLIADQYSYNLLDTQNLLSINKKVQILIGFTNMTGKYLDYPILWFPQGVYVITNPNITHNESGISISLSLHDKMALLNGECGGTFPSSVTFSQVETINEDGEVVITQPTIYQIIQQLMNHFGGEPLEKIIISDVDTQIKQAVTWIGGSPLYLFSGAPAESESIQNFFSTNLNLDIQGIEEMNMQQFNYGENIGYILTDFVYPGDLIANAGDTIVTILDKIKNVLGNYEYFYDINGNFRFQQIKNYLNKSYASTILSELTVKDYLVDFSNGKSVYSFEDADIVSSYSMSPQYQQIKNDFMVWGIRKTIDGRQVPIRYHLAIDSKPRIGTVHQDMFFLNEKDQMATIYDSLNYQDIKKAIKPVKVSNYGSLPQKGEFELYYVTTDNNNIYKWTKSGYELTTYTLTNITSTDYRTELYLQGVEAEPLALDRNYYYTELKNEWPKLFNMDGQNPDFKESVKNNPSQIDYFLDLIDQSSIFSQFSVNNIGRRTVVIIDNDINCIFEPQYPDLVIIQESLDTTEEIRNRCQQQGQNYVQVRQQIYSMTQAGGSMKSAYEQIRKELYQYTNYNEQVSLTTLPVYYLEPNTRITIKDSQIGLYGDYIIKSISLPLDMSGTMSISCGKALERI